MTKPLLVVKVGTSTLLATDERPSRTFEYVAESILSLRQSYEIILVTSGAIGFGVRQMALAARPTEIHHLQALSMIGQVGLLRRWREAFGETTIGQVLVTRHELEHHTTAALFAAAIRATWSYDVIPIVNENDAVSFEEISFGDNDRLAAEIAGVMGADILVFLTDQDGIQAEFGTPRQYRIDQATLDQATSYIATTKSTLGKGGAASKLQSAQIALESGAAVYIGHAGSPAALEQTLSGKSGTKIVQ